MAKIVFVKQLRFLRWHDYCAVWHLLLHCKASSVNICSVKYACLCHYFFWQLDLLISSYCILYKLYKHLWGNLIFAGNKNVFMQYKTGHLSSLTMSYMHLPSDDWTSAKRKLWGNPLYKRSHWQLASVLLLVSLGNVPLSYGVFFYKLTLLSKFLAAPWPLQLSIGELYPDPSWMKMWVQPVMLLSALDPLL